MLQLKKTSDFNGYTVIIPSVCVGNVAQLACDLLISTKQLERVGTIFHRALIPIFGPSAYNKDSEDGVAACEIYESAEEKLLIFQLRSPILQKYMVEFHDEIIKLISKARMVVILSGSFAYEKHVIDDSMCAYKATSNFKKLNDECLKNVNWTEFHGENIFGGGNALHLYEGLNKCDIPVLLLFRYLYEGNNTSDAALMVEEVCRVCNLLPRAANNEHVQLTIPTSWSPFFENESPDLMY